MSTRKVPLLIFAFTFLFRNAIAKVKEIPPGLDFNFSPLYSLSDVIPQYEYRWAERNKQIVCDIQGDELTVFWCLKNPENIIQTKENSNQTDYSEINFDKITVIDSRSLFNRQNCIHRCIKYPIKGQPKMYSFLHYESGLDPSKFIDI